LDEPPRLTVALPTCNGARHLRATLAGIQAQTGVDFDMIVSDDRSDDDTIAIVSETLGDRARISRNPERLGLAGNWNRCVALSRTPCVAILHQDDVLLPGHLLAHLGAFERNPDLGFVASAAKVIDQDGKPVDPAVVDRGGCGSEDRVFPPGGFVRELGVSNPLRCSAVTLNASAHAEVGGFDPGFRYAVDWDFWLRVARVRPIAWLAEPTVAIRWHRGSETHRFKVGTRDLEEIERLLGAIHDHDAQGWPDASEFRQRGRYRLARAYLNRTHDAIKAGDPRLARQCLDRAFQLRPGILKTIAADPRLAARLAWLLLTSNQRPAEA
jgi:glycosyltransferase involved in cell wall biosynthesis